MFGLKSLCRAMSSTSSNMSPRHLIAVCQLTSTHDLEANFDVCSSMIQRAKQRTCKMVFFPECFDYVGRNKEETISMAFPEKGPYLGRFRQLAKENGLWLSLGGFHNKVINYSSILNGLFSPMMEIRCLWTHTWSSILTATYVHFTTNFTYSTWTCL